jgi:hypothetical protein
MNITQLTKEHVYRWVTNHATVTNPYNKDIWYASVTIGYDYNGSGTSIEKAYKDLTDRIYKSPTIMAQLKDVDSFLKIAKKL